MKDPLHLKLKRYRVIPILILLFLALLTWDVWTFTKVNITVLQEWQLIPVATAFTTLITGLIAVVNNILNKIDGVD